MSFASPEEAFAWNMKPAGERQRELSRGVTMETVGAWFWSVTVKVRALLVVCAPWLSVATAVSVYEPSARLSQSDYRTPR